MESGSQSDSDGGGGRPGWPSPSTGSPGAPRDDGRPQPPRARDGSPDPGATDGQPPLPPLVLSLDQIRVSGTGNEYTDAPTVAQRSPASQKNDPGPRTDEPRRETREERPNNLRNLLPPTQRGDEHPRTRRSSSAEDSRSSARTSVGSASSAQRLLGGPAPDEQIIRSQPKRAELRPDELKPPSDVPGDGPAGGHSRRCAACGRCRCEACGRPRALPSCWACGRRCVCSAQSAAECATCVCCVRGLFYHCSGDDEATCADRPFSCAPSHRCRRWAAVSLLSLFLPCILCYLPAKGCLAACQCCYDRVQRPGCRC